MEKRTRKRISTPNPLYFNENTSYFINHSWNIYIYVSTHVRISFRRAKIVTLGTHYDLRLYIHLRRTSLHARTHVMNPEYICIENFVFELCAPSRRYIPDSAGGFPTTFILSTYLFYSSVCVFGEQRCSYFSFESKLSKYTAHCAPRTLINKDGMMEMYEIVVKKINKNE